MYNIINLSWFIIRRCAKQKHPISNLQLQKMLYFLQKLNLEKTGKALFNNKIVAWQFGPVIREAYCEFSIYSSLRIMPNDYDPNPNIELEQFLLDEIDNRAKQKPWSMVDETHQGGKAWDLIYKNGKGNGKEIPLELIETNG